MLTSGSFQGSEPLAIWLSLSSKTGVMYLRASRAASIAIAKASLGDAAAITGIGDSP